MSSYRLSEWQIYFDIKAKRMEEEEKKQKRKNKNKKLSKKDRNSFA